ncbi:MAG: hypothetical protein ACM3VT_09110, partial [Solirubrobacterales bacterium]
GLILFTLVAYACSCLLGGRRSDTIQAPIWFQATWCILQVPSVLLGAWLQMRRRTLPQKAPTSGVAGVVNDLWLSIRLLVDQFRPPIAVVVSIVAVFVGTYLGILLMGIGILGVRKLFGLNGFFLGASPLCLMISFSLSCVLARRVFRRIMTRDNSLMKDAE